MTIIGYHCGLDVFNYCNRPVDTSCLHKGEFSKCKYYASGKHYDDSRAILIRPTPNQKRVIHHATQGSSFRQSRKEVYGC